MNGDITYSDAIWTFEIDHVAEIRCRIPALVIFETIPKHLSSIVRAAMFPSDFGDIMRDGVVVKFGNNFKYAGYVETD